MLPSLIPCHCCAGASLVPLPVWLYGSNDIHRWRHWYSKWLAAAVTSQHATSLLVPGKQRPAVDQGSIRQRIGKPFTRLHYGITAAPSGYRWAPFCFFTWWILCNGGNIPMWTRPQLCVKRFNRSKKQPFIGVVTNGLPLLRSNLHLHIWSVFCTQN